MTKFLRNVSLLYEMKRPGSTKAAHFRAKQSFSIIARCDLPLASKVSRNPSWKVAKFVANLIDASCSAWRALSSLPLATSDDVHRNAKPRARQSTGGSTFSAICSAPTCDRCTRKRWEFLSAGKCIPCTPPNSRYFHILISVNGTHRDFFVLSLSLSFISMRFAEFPRP